MAKIYVKTILLVVVFVVLLLARLGLLCVNVLTCPEVTWMADWFLTVVLAAIVINEKFTKGEKWKQRHVLLLLFSAFLFAVARSQI